MKINSKLLLVASVFSVMSFKASSQININIQTDSIVNKMAAGFGMSITVYSTKKLMDGDKGLVNEE